MSNAETLEIMEMFEETGAVLKGHFLLTSGLHSDTYIQCAKLLQYPHLTEILCDKLAEDFKDDGIEVVIGPAMGGITLAYETGRALGARAIFAEREKGKMKLRRGFEIHPGERVLVIEDVVTTGGSVKEVIELVQEKRGVLVGVGILVDRSNTPVDFGVKTSSLLKIHARTFEPENCPLCRQNIPAVKPGSRNNI